ncbi:MAG TPA: alpha/beta hydrolase [Bacteroidales bacterium]|nr:alpha/beta hydrolase [Bacteroidales bacterium]
MELFYRQLGQGKPLIILHGLYGSSDNWMSIAKELQQKYTVIIPDQRNHGQSPHTPEHTYQLMAADLLEFTQKNNLQRFYLIGHSMGGRTAMLFQSLYPSMVDKLIVVDVPPWSYTPEDEWFRSAYAEHQRIIDALMSIKPENIRSRSEAERILEKNNLDQRLRNFLLKNLKRKADGFEWSINLPVLENNLEHLLLGVEIEKSSALNADVLIIRGDKSNYIPKYQINKLNEIYPKGKIVSIPDAGHWVHSEKPEVFLTAVTDFLG